MNLPTEELKEYGIITENDTFNSKLTSKDIANFLQGNALIASNNNDRVVFHLKNGKLDVQTFKLDKNIEDIIKDSAKNELQYSFVKNNNGIDFSNKAFIFDKEKNTLNEFDLIKDFDKIMKTIEEKKEIIEFNKFKTELLKLKGFLQDKIDKFPEIAKDISDDLNIVSKNISLVDDATPNEKQINQQSKSDIKLNVNDPDMYDEAYDIREKIKEEELERKSSRKR